MRWGLKAPQQIVGPMVSDYRRLEGQVFCGFPRVVSFVKARLCIRYGLARCCVKVQKIAGSHRYR